MKEYIMIKETGNAPVTVGELIRCKDCLYYRYSHPNEEHYCGLFNLDDDTAYKPTRRDYCSSAERKEE